MKDIVMNGKWKVDGHKTLRPRYVAKEAIEKVENTKFGWYHIRTILIAGSGFFTDAYDIFSVNMGILQAGLHLIK